METNGKIIRIISFHNGNIPQEVLDAQKSVFDHFAIPLEQIETQLQHPDAIDHFLHNERWDVVAIFDIDCIPLDADYLYKEIGFVLRKPWIVGAEQCASHIHGSIDYLSPAFIVLNRDRWMEMGEPSFAPSYRADVGGEITYAAKEHNIKCFFLPVVECEQPMWNLRSGRRFGIGTNYGDVIYHAFESRMNSDARNRFILKCQQVIELAPRPAHISPSGSHQY